MLQGATGASISFHTLCKNCYKTQTYDSIVSIFDTIKERIKVHSPTKSAMHLINIQGVMRAIFISISGILT